MNLSTVKSITIPEGNVTAFSIGGVKAWAVPQTAASPWDEVAAAIADGTYKTKYKIGDMVPLDLGSEGLINMQIAAFDKDILADGSGTAAISWASVEVVGRTKANPARASGDGTVYALGTGGVGGYPHSELRAKVQSIKPTIPKNVLDLIVPVTKKIRFRDENDTYKYNQPFTDDVWAVDANEYTSDVNWHKKTRVGYDTTSSWWCRDPVSSTYWQRVEKSGVTSAYSPITNYYLCLGFCTGRTPT